MLTLEEVLQLAFDEALIDAEEHQELVDELDDLRCLSLVAVKAVKGEGVLSKRGWSDETPTEI